MATIHISEAEAARDLAGLLAKVREGSEVMILNEQASSILLRADRPERRTLRQALALLSAASVATDEEFARDAAEAHENLNQPLTDPWA